MSEIKVVPDMRTCKVCGLDKLNHEGDHELHFTNEKTAAAAAIEQARPQTPQLAEQIHSAKDILLRERKLHTTECDCIEAGRPEKCEWDAVLTRLESEFADLEKAAFAEPAPERTPPVDIFRDEAEQLVIDIMALVDGYGWTDRQKSSVLFQCNQAIRLATARAVAVPEPAAQQESPYDYAIENFLNRDFEVNLADVQYPDHWPADEMCEKPVARIRWFEDSGDSSVGLQGWSGFCLTIDQSGTWLEEKLRTRQAEPAPTPSLCQKHWPNELAPRPLLTDRNCIVCEWLDCILRAERGDSK